MNVLTMVPGVPNFKEIAMLFRDKMPYPSNRYTPYDRKDDTIRVWIDYDWLFILKFKINEHGDPIEYLSSHNEQDGARELRGVQWEEMTFGLRMHSWDIQATTEKYLKRKFDTWTLQDWRRDITQRDHMIFRALVDKFSYIYVKMNSELNICVGARTDDLF